MNPGDRPSIPAPHDIREPDPHPDAAPLDPLIYEALRRLARKRLAGNGNLTIQATELVHEVYLRLAPADPASSAVSPWRDESHFFAAAAKAMRHVLVDLARRRARIKRGGGARRASLTDHENVVAGPPSACSMTMENEDLVALDDALQRLEQTGGDKGKRCARLVELRYFCGLTIEQTAAALGVTTRTADRDWRVARAWLYQHLRPARLADGSEPQGPINA